MGMTDRIRRLLCRWLGHDVRWADWVAYRLRQTDSIRCRRCGLVLEQARRARV